MPGRQAQAPGECLSTKILISKSKFMSLTKSRKIPEFMVPSLAEPACRAFRQAESKHERGIRGGYKKNRLPALLCLKLQGLQ